MKGRTAMATEAQVLDAMMQVEDPELGVNVVDLGLMPAHRHDRGRDQLRAGRFGRHPGGRDQLDLVAPLDSRPHERGRQGGAAVDGLRDLRDPGPAWTRVKEPTPWHYQHWSSRRVSCRGTRSSATRGT